MLQYSEINLNDHYANISGRFRSDDRGYAATGREFSLEVCPTALKLVGELRDCLVEYQMAETDLDVCIVNDNGQLKLLTQKVPQIEAQMVFAIINARYAVVTAHLAEVVILPDSLRACEEVQEY